LLTANFADRAHDPDRARADFNVAKKKGRRQPFFLRLRNCCEIATSVLSSALRDQFVIGCGARVLSI
jgi:hypothetical protein